VVTCAIAVCITTIITANTKYLNPFILFLSLVFAAKVRQKEAASY
jgi:hypothetical protein